MDDTQYHRKNYGLTRLDILQFIRKNTDEGKLSTIIEISSELGLSFSATQKHIRRLREQNLVESFIAKGIKALSPDEIKERHLEIINDQARPGEELITITKQQLAYYLKDRRP